MIFCVFLLFYIFFVLYLLDIDVICLFFLQIKIFIWILSVKNFFNKSIFVYINT